MVIAVLRPIRALIISDAPDHAELLSALRRADFDPSWRHTSTCRGVHGRPRLRPLRRRVRGRRCAKAFPRRKPSRCSSEATWTSLPRGVGRGARGSDRRHDAGRRRRLRRDEQLGSGSPEAVDRALDDAPPRRGAAVAPTRPAPGREDPVSDEAARQRLVLDLIPQIVWMAGADGSTHYLNRPGRNASACRRRRSTGGIGSTGCTPRT